MICGQFYQALGDKKFSPAPRWLSQMGGFKIFHTFFILGEGGESGKFLLLGGIGEVPSPLDKNLLISPPPGKFPQ